MRALLVLALVGCSPLDEVMDDCGDPIRVTAPKDFLIIFHHDDGEPVLQTCMQGTYVQLNAPSCHGAVTVVGGGSARTMMDVAPGEWLDFTREPIPEPDPVTAIETWSMRVEVLNAGTRRDHAVIEYLFGDDLVFADIIPLPSEAKHLVRGVPIRVTTSVHHENGVHDTVVDELPGVQAELTVDATRAPHIEDVVWNRERRRAFTYQLSKPADALVACEIWREFSWCVFADAEDALVMPLLPLELKPRGEPQIGFTAFDMSGDRVIASSSYASEAWIGYSAPLPIRIVAP